MEESVKIHLTNKQEIFQVVVSAHLKNTVLVKLDHFPRDRGENKKCSSCHHLELGESWLVNRDPYTYHGLLSSLYNWA